MCLTTNNMRSSVFSFSLYFFFLSLSSAQHIYQPYGTTTVGPPRQQQTRSLSGTPATDGDLRLNDEYFDILTLTIFKGINIFKIKMYNDRIWLDRNRRSYWFGDRYYRLDNYYYLPTRDTCAYRMNETQRKDLQYEDGIPIYDIIYQCQRYAEYCCGLDCCRLENLNKPQPKPRQIKYPWSSARSITALSSVLSLALLLF